MNIFRYVIGAAVDFEIALDEWAFQASEYINSYFSRDRNNIRNTSLWDCISKIQFLTDILENQDDSEQEITIADFRGVVDSEGLLQAIAILQSREIEYEGERFTGLAIESLTNAPWNTINQTQIQTRKGAATSLVEEIVKESQTRGFNGIVKVLTIPRARPFYRKIGFRETDGSGEMLLTVEAAQEFLTTLRERRQFQAFD